MNIREAKEEIIHTLRAYLNKDENGAYRFPVIRQRPILLMGPPGIGKTAIMQQIAQECGVGLVSYTMTHHTRQSAVGLPRLIQKNYRGTEVTVTEYTMSEMIASVYECMERTGKTEGILFVDEINCVSETLAPTMLQFLQNKTFGTHRVPEGWMIVAAGNPPEYNKSVREFDIVTLDRVRRIDIEADVDTWMEYAENAEVHGAVQSYLRLRRADFYSVIQEAEEKRFVTARGWEDLSEIMIEYEELEIPVTENLIRQYLQKRETARSFILYYQLYRKYGEDYEIDRLLEAETKETALWQEKCSMAQNAPFEERLTVIGLLLDRLSEDFTEYDRADRTAVRLHAVLEQLKRRMQTESDLLFLNGYMQDLYEKLKIRHSRDLISETEASEEETVIRLLEQYVLELDGQHCRSKEEGFRYICRRFRDTVEERSALARMVQKHLSRAFEFTADAFGEEQEMLLLVTGLLRNRAAMEFIRLHGNKEFLRYSRNFAVEPDADRLQDKCREFLEKSV